ncbi:MAG: preprotein translocase subunit SecD family protein [Candidatus Methanospirareceae archaeon]
MRKRRGELFDIRIAIFLIAVITSLCLIYVYPPPPPGAGINGNLRYGLDLVGGSWLQLKLEGVLVKINSPLNNTSVAKFLEEKLDTEVIPYRTDEGVIYEIRKSISKDNLSEILREINSSIARRADGGYFFEEGVTSATREETRRIIETKLNMWGLSGTVIRTVGRNLMLIDLPGVDIETAKDRVCKQGKFEVRIQTKGKGGDIKKGQRLEEIENVTAHVFYGSEGIDSKTIGAMPVREREDSPWGATFTLKEEGAIALREAAIKYGAVDNPRDHEVIMLLDDIVIYSAPLSEELAKELKEKPVYGLRAETGLGEEGFKKAKELIVDLKAGVLPVNVEVIGRGAVSAYLGEKFKIEALFAGFLALIFVTIVVYLRYRNKKIVLPIFFILLSEIIIILGFAAAIKWRLDLPSIAGIIAVIGTGVDQLVIITDEALSGSASSARLHKRVSFAYGIIFASATTTIVAMLALAFLALGTLRGFAIVTIFGLVVGLFITRPAYARIVEKIL